jgi:hypothetical protein
MLEAAAHFLINTCLAWRLVQVFLSMHCATAHYTTPRNRWGWELLRKDALATQARNISRSATIFIAGKHR